MKRWQKLMKRWQKLMKPRRIWFKPVLCFFYSLVFLLNSLEFDISEDPVAQIPFFSTRNCYGGVSYLEPSNLIFLICYWVLWWSGWSAEWEGFLYLVGSSNNRAPPPTTSLFSAIFTDNDEFFDGPVVRLSGAAYLSCEFRHRLIKPWDLMHPPGSGYWFCFLKGMQFL